MGVDNSIEVLNLEKGKTCSHNIADMPTSGGKSRNLHSLIYNPSNKEELLVYNGVSDEPLATCDSWSMKNATGAWKRHSYPNKGILTAEYLDDKREKYTTSNIY